MVWQILSIEDDAGDERSLEDALERYGKEVGEEFSVTWLSDAEGFISSRRSFDLVFMDIQLAGNLDGMEAAELFRTYDDATPLIFVTDLASYAVRGYAVDAIDFIVKPISYPNFAMRMDRTMRILSRSRGASVPVPFAGGERLVRVSDIVYVEVTRHVLHYHIAGEQGEFVQRGNLNSLERSLPPELFVRTSSSHLANMNHIQTVRSDEIVMDTGDVIRITRSCKASAQECIARFVGGTI